ncbi:hypothetical protein AAG906_006755 [Vitis piasezkii]
MASDTVVSLPNGNANIQPDPWRTYQVVVAATRDIGIGKDEKLPWRLPSDMKIFKDITMTVSDTVKKNAVIMGRKTWESIPLEHRPLPGRLNVVLTCSGSFDIATAENVVICGSMASALELLVASPYCLSIEKSLNAPGCDAIHITEIETSLNNNGDSGLESIKFEVKKFSFLPKMIFERNEEYMYLRLVEDIISNGVQKDDRTGTGTLSKFGCQKVFWRGVVEELLWFISGSTNAKV